MAYSNLHIFKHEGSGHLSVTKTVGRLDDGVNDYTTATVTLTPKQQRELHDFLNNEERAMLGSIHADGGASYEAWLEERSTKAPVPATLPEWAERLASGAVPS
jgi:hypothetical protein